MDTSPREARERTAMRALLGVFTLLVLGGCSLVAKSTRPVPGEERNLSCILEYRPDPDHSGPDLLFIAAANPYKTEQVYMNPVEMLVHGIFAPGRHLSEPAVVRGASCQTPVWDEGHRVPMAARHRHYLACTREGLEAVEFEVTTKWGSCRRTIPAGDDEPRCGRWYGEPRGGLRLLSQDVCPRCPPCGPGDGADG